MSDRNEWCKKYDESVAFLRKHGMVPVAEARFRALLDSEASSDNLRDDAFELRNLIDGTLYEERPKTYRTNARGEHLCIRAEKADLRQIDDGRILHVVHPTLTAEAELAAAKAVDALVRDASRHGMDSPGVEKIADTIGRAARIPSTKAGAP